MKNLSFIFRDIFCEKYNAPEEIEMIENKIYADLEISNLKDFLNMLSSIVSLPQLVGKEIDLNKN